MTYGVSPEAFEPPHAIDAEQSLLGAILHDTEALDRVRDLVVTEDFFEEVHARLFETMCARRDAGDAIDAKLVRLTLGNGDIGGLTVGQYLARLAASATTISGAPGYARAIRDAAQMRRVLETAQQATAAMLSGAVSDPSGFAAGMIEALDEVASSRLSDGLKRVAIGEAVNGVLERVQLARSGRMPKGTPYGLPSLDKATLGLRPDQLIILAGRPGMGKTTVALHVALSAARAGFGVGFVSLEMNATELSERALSAMVYGYGRRREEPITYRAISEGVGISDADFRQLQVGREACERLPLWIEQQPGLTVSQIAARARQMRLRADKAGIKMGVLLVDHIGLIRPSKRYAGNRVQEITEISGALKGLAKELGIPVLALAQLNREVEKRDDKRPLLSDLRDSGSIEQDADVVLGLFREAYYLEHKADKTDDDIARLHECQDTVEIEILKQRGGPTLRLRCFCDIACNVLAELA